MIFVLSFLITMQQISCDWCFTSMKCIPFFVKFFAYEFIYFLSYNLFAVRLFMIPCKHIIDSFYALSYFDRVIYLRSGLKFYSDQILAWLVADGILFHRHKFEYSFFKILNFWWNKRQTFFKIFFYFVFLHLNENIPDNHIFFVNTC